jgi:Skp family chaperone for outer membrane proteins
MITTRTSTWLVLGSVSLVAIGLGLHSSPKAAPVAKAQINAAVLNLAYVIRYYKKWDDFREVYKKKQEGFEAELKDFKQDIDKLTNEIATAGDDESREQLEKQKKDAQRSMDERTHDAKKELDELESKNLVEMYKEVAAAAERHAKAHGIEMELHCQDGTTLDEVNNPTNIGRKINQEALYPMYLAPGVDISKEVVAALNEDYDRAK